MKRLSTIMMCMFAMMAASLSAKAQEITINLRPGWNWIGYPNAMSMEINDAFGDFIPMEGDVIKSEFAFAEYLNGSWAGSLTHFMPGKGYMYCSRRTEETSFVFRSSTSQSQVLVTTSEPLLITAISAMCGGEVTSNDGTYIIMKGLCWATHENPTTNDDFYQEAESGVGSFSASMTGLNISTSYYVRAYAVTANGTVYGDQKTFTTQDGIPTVTTDTVTSITGATASCGGTVTDNGGLNVIARGVCWSTSQNPTVSDSHTTNDSGLGSFTSSITGLSLSTTYYVRAYATTSTGTGYGEQVSFTTLDDYEYIDLGLPSGLLWATCNVGATTPEDYGDYFAWGETQPKDYYNWSTYQYCNGSETTLTKYCTDASYGYNGFTDYQTTLLPEDDAAMANWGNEWRMPTMEEWQELRNNTTHTWVTRNGVLGGLFTASNGNSLFLPAAGMRVENSIEDDYYDCCYWSDSLTLFSNRAWCFEDSGSILYLTPLRFAGLSVRAVRSAQPTPTDYTITVTSSPTDGGTVTGDGIYHLGQTCTVTAIANTGYTFVNWTENGIVISNDVSYSFIVSENKALVANFTYSGGSDHEYVDLGLPSGLLWATCNVGADTPEDYGDYFAWGETQPKGTYNWSTYQYCNGSINTLTKYCNSSGYGYNGFTDNLTILLPEDDAATANWGSDWRMPTQIEWQELLDNTTCTWTTQNGVDGRLFTASNGNSLFLPAAGSRYGSSLYYAGSYGGYWSSSLNTDSPDDAWGFYFYSGSYLMGYNTRYYGQSVRAVRSSMQN